MEGRDLGPARPFLGTPEKPAWGAMDTNAKPVSVNVVPIAPVQAVVEPAVAPPVPAVAPAAPAGDFDQRRTNKQADQVEQAARYRLVIEEGPAQGTFIYKTLDSTTGEVVRQFPREKVLQMAERGDYSAGGLIDTSA